MPEAIIIHSPDGDNLIDNGGLSCDSTLKLLTPSNELIKSSEIDF